MRKIFLVASIAIFALACGDSKKNAEPFDVKIAFTKKCSLCHGADGKRMASGAPDLTQSTLDKAGLIAIITNGKNNMPPQREALSKEEIAQLADYVLKFRNN